MEDADLKTTREIQDLSGRRAEKPSRENARQERPWMECAGELADLHDETLRIEKIIDDECGTIEPDDA